MTTALVDADIVAYRTAATAKEDDEFDIIAYRIDVLMRQILEAADCSDYIAYLSGGNNFRKGINPSYKANRKDMPKPRYLEQAREFLVSEWNAKLTHNIEADDALGIAQDNNTIICSIDKDLLTVPGKHFNWLKQIYGDLTVQSKDDADRQFWLQMLTGDASDGVKGVTGIGPVKAAKALSNGLNNDEWFEIVYSKYEDEEHFLLNANCLWIMRHEDSEWHKDLSLTLTDELLPAQEALSKSMKSLRIGT
jgi:DNA polymerase I